MQRKKIDIGECAGGVCEWSDQHYRGAFDLP